MLREDDGGLLQRVTVLLDVVRLEQLAQRRGHDAGDQRLPGRRFGLRFVEQPTLHGRRRGSQRRVLVGDRHVEGMTRLDGDRQPDQVRAHRRLAVGDDVQREPAGRPAGAHEGVDRRGLDDRILARHRLRDRRIGRDQRPELELGEQPERVRAVGAGVAAVVGDERDGAVGVDRDQLLALSCAVDVGEKRLAIPLLLHLAGAREQRVEAAELRDQIAGALLADAGNALHVVGRVAHQREHVDHLLRRDAELLLHAFGVEPRPGLTRVEDLDGAADELEEVLVAGDERDLEALRRRLLGQRAHDVVGFVAARRQDRHAEGAARLVDQRHLVDQIGRHRSPRRLVVGGQLTPEARSADVERRGEELGLVVGDQLREHGHEAVDGVRDLAGGVGHRRQGMVRPVHLVAAVDEEEAWRGHGLDRQIYHLAP